MLFTETFFLFYFLPFTLLVHRLLIRPGSAVYSNKLLVTSFLFTLFFYGFHDPWWLIPFFVCVGFDYCWGYLLGLPFQQKWRNLILFLSICQNLSLLALFKYQNFISDLFSGSNFYLFSFLPRLQIEGGSQLLPAGISFYTLESLSFVIDIYRRRVNPPKNPLVFLGFIGMYPRFIAGPIVRYRELTSQFSSYKGMFIEQGLIIFMAGFIVKIVFADSFSVFTIYAFGKTNELSFGASWIGAISYTFQIYFDFWGYSLMAIGLGRCFGFEFPQNFNKPYHALSLREFWQRWHMSLSSWIRDYIYVPIGGKHLLSSRTGVHLLLTMLISGLWHGASLNFVLWGFWHGIGLGIEIFFPKISKLPKFIRWLYTFLFVTFGLVLFKSRDLNEFFRVLDGMFSPTSFQSGLIWELLQRHPLQMFCVTLAIVYFFGFEPKLRMRKFELGKIANARSKVLISIFFLLGLLLNASSEAVPFVYFQF